VFFQLRSNLNLSLGVKGWKRLREVMGQLFSAVAWAPPGRKEDAPRSGAKLVLRTLKNTHTRFPYEKSKKNAPDLGAKTLL
jgi:hypothetical protein